MTCIHESAFVDKGAQVGEGSRIWHFCHIESGAQIGRDCTLGQNVYIGKNVQVGDGCKIQNNVSLYTGVTLESQVFCGPSVVFTNVATPRSAFPRNQPLDFLPTRIQHGATLGANSTILCGINIGRWAFVGAGAVVTRDVPAYGRVVGVPARLIGWSCVCGQGLEFKNRVSICAECGANYTQVSSIEIKACSLPVLSSEGFGPKRPESEEVSDRQWPPETKPAPAVCQERED